MDGVFEIVHPGERFVYDVNAEPAGLHLYHCHAVPLKRHIHKGLYGTFIVDPADREAYWAYEMDRAATIPRLASRTITIPFGWVEGEPVEVTLVTSTGLTFSSRVEVATVSPSVNARYLTTFALLGIYVGVIPVFLGLLWLPFLSDIPRKWLDLFLSLTLGLLVFLGADALAEALELRDQVASAFQGTGLVVLGLLGAPLVIEGASRLRRTARAMRGGWPSSWPWA